MYCQPLVLCSFLTVGSTEVAEDTKQYPALVSIVYHVIAGCGGTNLSSFIHCW